MLHMKQKTIFQNDRIRHLLETPTRGSARGTPLGDFRSPDSLTVPPSNAVNRSTPMYFTFKMESD